MYLILGFIQKFHEYQIVYYQYRCHETLHQIYRFDQSFDQNLSQKRKFSQNLFRFMVKFILLDFFF